METLSFENLPNAVDVLSKQVIELTRIVLDIDNSRITVKEEKFLNIQETADFLNLKRATIYTKVSRRELPFMKRGKRLYFSKSELLEYLKKGKVKTQSEGEVQSHSLLLNKKGSKL